MKNGICLFQKKRFKGNNLTDSGNNPAKYLLSFTKIKFVQIATISDKKY